MEGVKVGTKWVQNPLLRRLLALLVLVILVMVRLCGMAQGKPSSFQWIWSTLASPEYDCPRLMLYSEADVLVRAEAVEEFVAVARKQGVKVVTQKWKRSAHVRHFPEHPEEYVALIHQHILQPLAGSISSSSSRPT